MELETRIVKYIKEETDIFNDGELYTTYTEVVYIMKSMKTITEKEYLKQTKK